MNSSAVHWYNRIPDHVKEILQTLHTKGYRAFLAGGAVRDFELGLVPKDYDVATDAGPDEVAALFPKTLDIGKAFGITVVITPHGTVEVARFRSDGNYSNQRHPDHVEFSNPEEDAKRRDFTINALFFDPMANEIIDYVGGLSDLKQKIIKAVGEPEKRIQEDALRMLRAIRFTAQFSTLGFQLESRLLSAIQKNSANIGKVSKERITQEILLLLKSGDAVTGILKLVESGLWGRIFATVPPLDQARLDELAHLWKLHFTESPWLLFLGAIFRGKNLKQNPPNLLLDNELRQNLEWLGSERPKDLYSEDLARRKPASLHPAWREGLVLFGLETGKISEYLQWRKQQIENQTLNPKPLIAGDDLKALGFTAGPAMGAILQKVREAQLREQIFTKEEALAIARA